MLEMNSKKWDVRAVNSACSRLPHDNDEAFLLIQGSTQPDEGLRRTKFERLI
jgi:hypothetical protein